MARRQKLTIVSSLPSHHSTTFQHTVSSTVVQKPNATSETKWDVRDVFKSIGEECKYASKRSYSDKASIERLCAIKEKIQCAIEYLKKKEATEPQLSGTETSRIKRKRKAKKFTIMSKKRECGVTKNGKTSKRTWYYCSGGEPCKTSKNKRNHEFKGHQSREGVQKHIDACHSADLGRIRFSTSLNFLNSIPQNS